MFFSVAVARTDIIGVPIYMKRGTQNRTWFFNINNISTSLGSELFQNSSGIHTFTDYDLFSAFAEKIKVAAMKLLGKDPTFQNTFSMIVEEIEVKCMYHERISILSLIFNISAFTFLVRVTKRGNTNREN